MAGQDGPPAAAVELERALASDPYRFDFYQALRRLENAYPGYPRVGEARKHDQDIVRLAQEPSLAFAPSSLASYRPRQGDRPGLLTVLFFGLFGPNGALPLHLTEYARDRLRNSSDPTLSRFLDIFHHRMLSLFYRAWANAQPAVQFDRPDRDRFATYVGSLIGLGMPSLCGRDELPDLAKLHHAGALACQTRHPDGLRGLLSDFFRQPVAIDEFVGEWLELRGGDLCRLGESPGASTLGSSVTLGSRTWECQHRFRVVLGPLRFADYKSFLPGQDDLLRLRDVVRNYVGHELAWEVRLMLRREQVPALCLDGRGRLGWTTWLASAPPARDPDDLTLCPEETAA